MTDRIRRTSQNRPTRQSRKQRRSKLGRTLLSMFSGPLSRRSAPTTRHQARFVEPLEDRRLLSVTTAYVANAADFTDPTHPGNPQPGDTVTWNGGGQFTTPVLGLTFGTDAFTSIADAVANVSSGGTVDVAPGTYDEHDIALNQPITIDGPNFGVNPNTGTRTAEATVDALNTGDVFAIAADDVTIDGFTVQNAANAGILMSSANSGAQILDNTVTNNSLGIYAGSNGPSLIQDNLITANNKGGPAGGTAIYSDAGINGLTINNNVINDQTVNSAITLAAVSAGQNKNVTISNNVVDINAGANSAIYLDALDGAVISSNDITTHHAGGAAIKLAEGDNDVSIHNNSIHDNVYGVWVVQNQDFSPAVVSTNVSINYNSITGSTTAALNVDGAADVYTGTLDASKNWWGDISGPTIANNRNPGGLGQTIVDPNGQVTYRPWLIYGTDANATAPGFQLPTTITVTAPGDVSPAVNDYTTLANAIASAASGQTIQLAGTFDWTKTDAAAAWAKGVNGIDDTTPGNAYNDDYAIIVPGGVNNVTVTASSLGGATIQGPGDLPNVDFEGVLEFYNPQSPSYNTIAPNTGWTISNLQIYDFDLSLYFYGGPGAFDNTTITNNHIRVAADAGTAADPSQNIGIDYSEGKDQTISNNVIDLSGNGSSPASGSVGMQSSNSGVNYYDGLKITGNTINVLHAQSAAPVRIIGIWENAGDTSSNITVSGNTFDNLDANNNPALNDQLAFRLTSASGAASTVLYQNNTVSGAHVGFQYYPSEDNSGTHPVQFVGNTLTNVFNGFDFDNGAKSVDYLSGNTVTGTGTAGVGIGVGAGSVLTTDGATGTNAISGFATGVDLDGGTGTLTQNTITGNGTGVIVGPGGTLVSASQNFVTGNTGDGISIDAAANSVGGINGNDLSGNGGLAVNNLSGNVVDASGNWWGSVTGPTVGTNPSGTGAKVSANVDYTPWLNSGVDTDLVTPGFQADFSSLTVSATSPQAGAVGRIQEAVNLATAGGTVHALPGTYAENITIGKDVTLTGPAASPPTVIIHPTSGDGITIASPAANVTIESIEVTGAGNGISANGVTNLTLNHLLLDGNATGFVATGVTTLNLSDLTLTGNSTAGGNIAGVSTVNDTPVTGSTGATDTITGSTIQRGSDNVINYIGVTNLNVTGSDGSDTFNVTPATATVISISGGLPTPPTKPGDTLTVNTAGTTSPALSYSSTPNGDQGSFTFANAGTVNFQGIETLTGVANLTITKTDNSPTPGFAVPGAPLTYTIVVTNTGPNAANGATVTDNLPPGFMPTGYTSTASTGVTHTSPSGGGNISDTLTAMPVGGSITYTITGKVSPSATGPLTNTATASIASPVLQTVTATDSDTLTSTADLSITKTDNSPTPGQVQAGSSLTYTITVTNSGPSDVNGANIIDTFPGYFTNANYTATATGGATGFSGGSGTVSGNLIDDTAVNLPAGSKITYTVTGMVSGSATGNLTNTATVTVPAGVIDTNTGNNSATDTDTVSTQTDLSITKSDDHGGNSATSSTGTAVAGNTLTYTIVVSNTGPGDVTGATVTDTFPAGFTVTNTTSSVTGTATITGSTGSGGNINDTVNLRSGSSITYTVTGTISPSASVNLSNTATVTPPANIIDTNAGNNSATDTDTLTQQVDVGVTKTDGVSSATAGTSTTYTIVVSNTGPSTATNVAVSDLLPAGVTSATWSGNSTSGTGALSNTIASLAPGASVTYTMTVQIGAAATGTLANSVSVTAANDSNLANNTASDTDNVTAQADLSITKSDNKGGNSATSTAGSVMAGSAMTYIIVVSNAGPSNATGATVTDTFPANFQVTSTTPSFIGGASITTQSQVDSQTLTDIVNLPAGGAIIYVVTGTVSASASGTLSNTANVGVPAGVTNTGSTSATDTDTVTGQVNLSVTKTDNKGGNSATNTAGSVAAGTPLTYTIVVSNSGPSGVTGATITDPFPAGFNATGGTTHSSTGGASITHESLLPNGGFQDVVNLPVGGSITYVVSGTVASSASGTLSNTTTVAVPGGVNNTGSTSATDTDNVTTSPPPSSFGYLAGVPGDNLPQTFVQNLYRELLGREPDAGGEAFWITQVQQNNTPAGRQAVIADFLNSQEYKEHYIATLYQVFLGRTPEAAALQFWTAKMGSPGTAGAHDGGADEKHILSEIVGSDEFYARAGGTDQSFAQALYQDLLGRPGESAGINFWGGLAQAQPQNRDGIVRQFLSTPEAEHKLLDSFYPAPGGTASNPLPAPGTGVPAGTYDLAVVTGLGWENLYLEGPFDNSPEGNDAFFADLANGGSWDDVQFELLASDQFYSNPNRPVTA